MVKYDSKACYIIVPDVHGRTFYYDAVDMFMKNSKLKMIFLGDYVDPYPQEQITKDDALKRFKKIIEFKQRYQDRITLLIGNHDLHYFDGSRTGCRMDFNNKQEISDLFMNNMDLFEWVKCEKIGKSNFIFSHAGIPYNWFDTYAVDLGICKEDEKTDELVEENFTYNNIKNIDWKELAKDQKWIESFGDVGSSRGGWCSHPSFLWADLSDQLLAPERIKGCKQVFGHTIQTSTSPVKFDNYYCLDCRNVFYINEKGNVVTTDYKSIYDNGKKYKEAYMAYFRRMSYFF